MRLHQFLPARACFFCLFSVALTAAGNPPRFKRVITVVLENHSYSQAMAEPYMASLAAQGTLFTQMYALGRPSQPNYLGLVAGDTFGADNSPQNLQATSIVDLLEAKKKTWKVYAEGYPGNCYLHKRSGHYVRKHVPMLSFVAVTANPARCGKIVNAAEFTTDLGQKSLPDYSLYIPDNEHNGHDTGVAATDRWLQSWLQPLLSDKKLMAETLIIVTFDEANLADTSNHIYTVFLGGKIRAGYRSNKRYDLYSILRFIEDSFQLGNLRRHDADAAVISDIWNDSPGKK